MSTYSLKSDFLQKIRGITSQNEYAYLLKILHGLEMRQQMHQPLMSYCAWLERMGHHSDESPVIAYIYRFLDAHNPASIHPPEIEIFRR